MNSKNQKLKSEKSDEAKDELNRKIMKGKEKGHIEPEPKWKCRIILRQLLD